MYCSAYGCDNAYPKDKVKGITFHQFPQDQTLKKKWAFSMKRNKFQPSNNSRVCSVHFRTEDFEQGSKLSKDRLRKGLKRNAIPSIFTSGLPVHLQAPVKTRRTLNRVKHEFNLRPKLPPVCIADDNPCCEREAWQNMPIVSNICNKCALFCGKTKEAKEREHAEKKPFKCDMCGKRFMSRSWLARHMKHVHKIVEPQMKLLSNEQTDDPTQCDTTLSRSMSHQEGEELGDGAGVPGVQDEGEGQGDRCPVLPTFQASPSTLTPCSTTSNTSMKNDTRKKKFSDASVQAGQDKNHAFCQTELKQSDIDALLDRVKFLEARHQADKKQRLYDKKVKKQLRSKIDYLLKKNERLLEVIANMRKKELISKQAALVLSDRFSDVELGLIRGLVKDRKKGQKYTKDQRDFCVTLFYYSPRAYKYVKKLFSLPHVTTIRRWLGTVDAYPGILCHYSLHFHNISTFLTLDAREEQRQKADDR